MIRGNQKVVGIRGRQLFHQPHQILQRPFDRFESQPLGVHLVAGMIDAVVIDVHHIMHLQQFTAFIAIEPHEVLAGDGRAAFPQCRFQNPGAIGGAL